MICGIGVALGGTTVGDGCPACCADAAPTAARMAKTELPSSNSFRTDLNMFTPQVDADGTEN